MGALRQSFAGPARPPTGTPMPKPFASAAFPMTSAALPMNSAAFPMRVDSANRAELMRSQAAKRPQASALERPPTSAKRVRFNPPLPSTPAAGLSRGSFGGGGTKLAEFCIHLMCSQACAPPPPPPPRGAGAENLQKCNWQLANHGSAQGQGSITIDLRVQHVACRRWLR